MKRLNYLVNGLAALALIVLFSQCAGKADNQAANASTQAAGLSGMKIAYVEIDTLLSGTLVSGGQDLWLSGSKSNVHSRSSSP